MEKLRKVIGACLSHGHVFSLVSMSRQSVGMPLTLQKPEALRESIKINFSVARDLSHHLVQYFYLEMKIETKEASDLLKFTPLVND